MLFCDWDECLKRIAMVAPETEPGREQLYHYLSYGWLCGGIIEVPLITNAPLLLIRVRESIFLDYFECTACIGEEFSGCSRGSVC